VELMAQKRQPFYRSRAFRQGSIATVITALFIAVMVSLNLFVGVLAERHQWWLDLTAEQVFALSDESIQFLAELDADITIYVLTPETNLTAMGIYFVQANEVLRQYAALSPHITVRYIDLTRDPAFAARFPQFQLNAQTILLETENRIETLHIFDLFNIETDFRGSRIVSSRAEQALTSMLLFLTIDRQVTVGVLTGFGESDSSALISLLETNRYRVITQNLLTEEISPEVTMLIINAPIRDYPQDAIARLEQFLQSERDVSLLYFAGINQPMLPNLEAFLAGWGIIVNDGIIYQTSPGMTRGGPYLSLVHYTEDFYSRHAVGFFSVMPSPRPLEFLFHQRGDRTVSAPLIFGETACIRPLDADDDWSPRDSEAFGPFAALAITYDEILLDDKTLRTSAVAVFASQHFVDAERLLDPYAGNAQFMLGLVQGLTDHMGEVPIAPKVIGAAPLPITDFQTIIFGILFVVVLPLAVIFAGGVVFLRRRHM